jgi:hypothetical protein
MQGLEELSSPSYPQSLVGFQHNFCLQVYCWKALIARSQITQEHMAAVLHFFHVQVLFYFCQNEFAAGGE